MRNVSLVAFRPAESYHLCFALISFTNTVVNVLKLHYSHASSQIYEIMTEDNIGNALTLASGGFG